MAHPHPGSTVLADAENIVIIPLYTITMVYTNVSLCFTTWEYDPETNEECKICCIRVTELPSYLNDLRPRVPVLFEVIGQITREECFLTADGYEGPDTSGQEDEHLATCWIESRHDHISRIYWLGIVPAIQEITSHISEDVDTSRLLAEDHGKVLLQVCYQPPAGQSITSALPLYNIRGERQVPSCIAEVPFGQPMRVVFALQSCYRRDEPNGERVLIAVLEHMVNL